MVKQGSLFLLNKTFYLLLILFLIACSKESALVRDKNGDFINIENSQVISAKALEWRVGKGNNKGYVSKGFLSKIELPYFSDDDLTYLSQKYGVNSFVIKISRDRNTRRGEFIGHYLVKFTVKTNSDLRVNFPEFTQSRIYYAATSISERFLKFPCPAFDHRYIIDEINIEHDNKRRVGIIRNRGLYGQKSLDEAGFIPQSFNGGMSLEGVYSFYFALYSTSKKQLMTEFVELSSRVTIPRESTTRIDSCNGFTIPAREETPSLKDIKFGR